MNRPNQLSLSEACDDPQMQKWLRQIAAERRRVDEDREGLRVREENLRAYEERLLVLQAQQRMRPETQPSLPAAPGDTASQSAWDKFVRAREILEAEQSHLLADQLALREEKAALGQQAEALAAREQEIAAREAHLAATEAAAASTRTRVVEKPTARFANVAPTAAALARSLLPRINPT